MKKRLVLLVAAVAAATMVTGVSVHAEEDDSLARIQEAGELKIGTEGTYAPFTYYDENDKLVGYDVEIAETVCEKLGVEPNFVETIWEGMIAVLNDELVFYDYEETTGDEGV